MKAAILVISALIVFGTMAVVIWTALISIVMDIWKFHNPLVAQVWVALLMISALILVLHEPLGELYDIAWDFLSGFNKPGSSSSS